MKKFILKILSAAIRIKLKLFSHSFIHIHPSVILHPTIKIKGPGTVTIEEGCNLWTFEEPNRFFTYTKEAQIHINKNTRLNGATFHCRDKIEIGENCLIGSANIIDNDFHHLHPEKRKDKSTIPTKPIKIENNVWLAGQTAILKGVTVGKNSVIGFRSVVNKNIPTNSVTMGNPAEVIKTIELEQ